MDIKILLAFYHCSLESESGFSPLLEGSQWQDPSWSVAESEKPKRKGLESCARSSIGKEMEPGNRYIRSMSFYQDCQGIYLDDKRRNWDYQKKY